jgi:RNA polymerase subunit RPABC4/transcription elongation factor Spt4
MAMVCTRCNAVHEQRLHCPTCGAALVYHAPQKQGFNYAELARGWQHTDWGRFIIGVGLAQGLFYGLYLLVRSIAVAANGEGLNSPTLPPMTEVACVQGLQVFGLLIGCVIAGVARRQAFILGIYIGVANAILSYMLGQWPIQAINTPLFFAQPFIQIGVGATACLISGQIWKPLAVVTLPETPSRMAKRLGAKRPRVWKSLAGPISWLRILLGVGVGIAGCMAAKYVLDLALTLSDKFSMDDNLQDSMLLWGLRGIALLLGGMVAGAGTANGLKQGLMAGMFSGVVMNVLMVYRNAKPEVGMLSLVLAFTMTLLGGWFGGQLLPRVVARRKLDSIGP